MWNTKLKIFALLFVCQFFITTQSVANEIRIAVASNFYPTMKEVVKQFEIEAFDSSKASKIVLIPGSSGKHYAQIINGAPFDLFFSADKIRPVLLEQQRISKNESRFTYALGKLALWSPIKGLVDSEGQILYDKDFRFLAIANPKIAPYGIATKETLVSMKLWQDMNEKLVRGENIAQAFQFISSGNAELGFVSFSQLMSPNFSVRGSFWEVPQSLYNPIEQQAVLLTDSSLGRDFMLFVQTDKALNIISKFGYDLP
ncbi:MAG: molybdate ABC transporter substrate-binding protein [Thiotrichales bacterium]|jgi:molybdate transport system substrate-binding protein|nr:molybdate ABC transporter substrate-binding protein [Thiotrichales bacterium]MBT3854059.1 molybdate ABC transporter substrate-binding protein [Thiotrichales bacterium]MBT4653890.1 molybdate ABC transporter substrate-binding protein [Thiotrichales bacterium]MBT5499127.1 molybdate ABC transporter substrate-binding protein [Thiotrichales bacterium]MBT5984670.1 molybdate ABC transporter substrate-binding protein [Thiotrichales bacterium]